MSQCPVIVDYKYLGMFPKLSSMHASDVTQKQLCDVKSINKVCWLIYEIKQDTKTLTI